MLVNNFPFWFMYVKVFLEFKVLKSTHLEDKNTNQDLEDKSNKSKRQGEK